MNENKIHRKDTGNGAPDTGELDMAKLAAETRAVREGIPRTPIGEHSEPIFATSSFVFDSASHAAACFANEVDGYIYSRFSNPNVDSFERRLAALEQGEACVATASGMSAILATVMTLLKQGDHVVASQSMFGSTVTLFNKLLPRFGLTTDFVNSTSIEDWEKAIRPETRMLFLETPTNPLMQLLDIRALADLAESNNIYLVVDNCFCTPALQRPLQLGAHLVTHSATKYLDGQGRCVGGAVVMSDKAIQKDMIGFMRSAGPSMSPFNAWVFNKGLETLSLRMQRHCENAGKLADWLSSPNQKAIRRVYYPGLKDHPQYDLAQRQQDGAGGVVSFEVEDRATAWRIIDKTQLLSITANLGDAKTTITHPATTSHGRLSAGERAAAGISDGLIRVAVGLEAVEDVIADLEQALQPASVAATSVA